MERKRVPFNKRETSTRPARCSRPHHSKRILTSTLSSRLAEFTIEGRNPHGSWQGQGHPSVTHSHELQRGTEIHWICQLLSAFDWNPACQVAFNKLKTTFMSAPLLILPDPDRQFIVENGTMILETGSCSPSRWPWWSEDRGWIGLRSPFLVLMDHKNLKYLKTSKRRNSRQTRWALFFTRFRFTMSYRPGSENGKSDALSRIYKGERCKPNHALILPDTCFVSTFTWEIEVQVNEALKDSPSPAGCPANRLYAVPPLRGKVIDGPHELHRVSPGHGQDTAGG
ncbi:uncharacterized protein LOC133510172 isoform X2 [Syngnathoides biaculeatus]|uniref:uncharacterized protein LOC133510172 isoform X2 n=1 Tax=Syngnathoides biaculeatus TaxID=300417 RepID=UPI002ADE0023|nr:uncharacterized protein LOC133510172 isoform X2 [Syngnathoides biaculeatus]